MKKLYYIVLSLVLSFNTLSLPIALYAQEATSSATNQTTGSSSTNAATNTASAAATVNNSNDTVAQNNTTADLGTGNNDANHNSSNSAITTGDSTGSASATTTVNKNAVEPMPWTTWTGEGDWTNNYNAGNTQTGSNSTNAASNAASTDTTVNNTNTADVTNNTNAASVTGGNTASDNTGDAAITTGTASFVFDGKNIVNVNGTAVWSGEGDWTTGYNGDVANMQTGSGSDNQASNSANNSTNINNSNEGNLVNNLQAIASSGANKASDNTGNGSIQTGDANLVASLFNMLNTNIVGTTSLGLLFKDIYGENSDDVNLANATYFDTAELGSTLFGLSSSNTKTGSDSSNAAANDLANVYSIDNENDGSIVNDLDLTALTGGNKTNDNTGNGDIVTGDASIMANLINLLNTNIVTADFVLGVINVFGSWTGNLILPEYNQTQAAASLSALSGKNNTTGSNSNNTADNSNTSTLDITNTNTAAVGNNLDLNAETGNNKSNDNTLGGTVQAGSSTVEAGATTFANQNIVTDKPWWLVLVNNMGKLVPQLIGPDGTVTILGQEQLAANSLTGSDSENSAANTTNSDTTISNTNNGTIQNNIKADANTGDNSASDNTGSGSILTGNAEILVSALNFINTNITTPNLVISLVNVFGDWNGGIKDHVGNLLSGTDNAKPHTESTNNQNTGSTNTGGVNLVTIKSDPNDAIDMKSNTESEQDAPELAPNQNTETVSKTSAPAKVLAYFDTKDVEFVDSEGSQVVETAQAKSTFGNESTVPTSLIGAAINNQAMIVTIMVLAVAVILRRSIFTIIHKSFMKRR